MEHIPIRNTYAKYANIELNYLKASCEVCFMSMFSLLKLGAIISKEVERGGIYERLDPPLKSISHVHFIQFRRRHDDIGEVYGLATHTNLKIAKVIAYFEYLDRKAFLQHSRRLGIKSTNGIAAHTFRLLASNAAKHELIERDAFLAHWYLQKPMLPISVPASLMPIQDELRSQSWSLKLFRTYLGFEPTWVALLIDDRSGGFVTGSCAGKSEKSAIHKATIESLINLFFGSYGKTSEELLSALEKNGYSSLEAHRTHWLLQSQIPEWMLSQVPRDALVPIETKPSFKVTTLSTDPFPVVSVSSPEILSLKLGLPDEEDFNRLTKRIGNPYKFSRGEPHPLF